MATALESPTLEEQFEQYQRDGYILLEQVYDAEIMDELRQEFHAQQRNARLANETEFNSRWFGNMLERAPGLMSRMLLQPQLLDFAERIMGPYVQLDNLTLTAFPSNDPDKRMQPVNWHRDRWAHLPLGVYERPNAINAICYGQDMTDEYGPLRVIPGSHIIPMTISKEERQKPHPQEVYIYAKAGDVIVTHNGLLHSGTLNTSGDLRYFYSIYLNQTWMKPTDNLDGPAVTRLAKRAEERNDRRAMRLFGRDPLIKQRNNWGFHCPDEEQFAEWIAEDRALVEADPE